MVTEFDVTKIFPIVRNPCDRLTGQGEFTPDEMVNAVNAKLAASRKKLEAMGLECPRQALVTACESPTSARVIIDVHAATQARLEALLAPSSLLDPRAAINI